VVERLLHTQEVAGSNPASRTVLLAVGVSAYTNVKCLDLTPF
jgi:hypothetical protein